MNRILIDKICKSFDGRTVLCGFSAEIEAGTFLCIAGPSGCGKTTLLRILTGLEKADSGTVRNVPKRISAVFQEDRLCPDFSVLSNVRIAATCDAGTCIRLIAQLGLQDHIHKPVNTLSGGQRRRVAVARCLAHEAELYIMDEPLSGLDPATAETVMDVIEEYTHGKTVVIAAHTPVREDKIKTKYLK